MALRKQRDERSREQARASGLIGRARELEQLEAAFADPAIRVAYVCGPLGVGKTEMLRAWAARAEASGARVQWIDGRAGVEAVDEALVAVDDLDDPAAQARAAERIASLPPSVRVIVASHVPPSANWLRVASSMVVVSLRPLERESSVRLLEAAGVPDEARESIVTFARGSPLLLALAAEHHRARAAFGARCEETVCEELAHRILAFARDESDVTALAALCVARFTTLEILAEVMPSRASAFEVHRWLSTCCRFVERTPFGLRPVDVARRALSFHFARQHPMTVARVHAAVQRYCTDRLQQGVDVERWLLDRIHLDRHVPLLGELVAAAEHAPPLTVGTAHAGEEIAIAAIAEAQLGPDAARATREWLARGSSRCNVAREGGRVVGFSLCVDVPPNARLPVDDPVIAAVAAHCGALGWLVAEAPTTLHVVRAWAVRDTGQRPSAAALHLIASQVARVLATRGSFLALVLRDPAPWLETLRALGIERQAIACGDDAIVVCDWRARSLADALAQGTAAAIDCAASLHDAASSEDVVAEAPPSTPATPAPSSPLTRSAAEAEPDLGRMLQRRIDQIADEARLSRREREVLQLLFMGRNTEEIGIALGITARTAKFHQAGVLRKVGADSRLDLLRILL